MGKYLNVKTKRMLIRIIPFVISATAGIVLYFLANKTINNLNSILINLSATLLAVPLIYMFYQCFVNLSEKRLNKEIYDYSKMLIDGEILSILNQLGKFCYSNYEFELKPKNIEKVCSFNKQ